MSKKFFAVILGTQIVGFIDSEEQKGFLISENSNYIFAEFEWNLDRLFYPQDFSWDGKILHFVGENSAAA